MKRRNFLKNALATAGAVVSGAVIAETEEPEENTIEGQSYQVAEATPPAAFLFFGTATEMPAGHRDNAGTWM